MAHPLEGPRLKVERAMGQISVLRGIQNSLWKDSQHEIVRAELNPRTGKYAHRARGDFSLSLDWGVTIGEIAHNLRSALDITACQLARQNGATPDALTRTYFPIFDVGRTVRRRRHKPGRGKPPKIWHFECDGREQIKALSDEHQAMIERLQPYHRRASDQAKGRSHPLYWLREINNADKHRLIQVVGMRGTGVMWGAWASGDDDPFGHADIHFASPAILEDGAKILEASPHVVVNTKIMPMIAFAEGSVGIRNRGAVGTLEQASETVSGIVQRFWGEF